MRKSVSLIFIFLCSCGAFDTEDSINNDQVKIDSANVQIQTDIYDVDKPTEEIIRKDWTNKQDFIDSLKLKKNVQYGDDYHFYLSENYSYNELLNLTKNESKIVRVYSIYQLGQIGCDSLYKIARSFKNDTAVVLSIWKGRSDEHRNYYTVEQIAAQSVLWYPCTDSINEKQREKLTEQINKAPINCDGCLNVSITYKPE